MEMEEGSQGKEHLLQSISGIMETTQEPFQIQEHSFYINMSIGVSVYPEDGETIDLLLQRADSALYRAKETGRNRYCFYDDSVSNRIFERMVLETVLRDAIREGQITAYFQPQIDAKTDRIAGVEALVRWQHPEKGLLTPDLFISVAEESGMIIELDRLVMRYAVEQFSTWKAQGYELGRLSLNLSVHQIEEAGFIEFIKTLLDAYPNVQEAIELEIMENAIMGNPERSIVILQQLRDMGIYLAIDDFGTGYSSLAYLKKFPINTLKIDKSFVDDLPDDTEDVAISKTIIDLANNLNMRVVAEGVETREQNDFLLANGCHYMQGHYYSHPLSAEAIEAFFREHA
jgi:EAL domain-containing protein (putative c-di-GMP-specific phosphodiesterase class I)